MSVKKKQMFECPGVCIVCKSLLCGFLCEVHVGRKTGEAKTRVRLCAKPTSSDMNENQKYLAKAVPVVRLLAVLGQQFVMYANTQCHLLCRSKGEKP